MELIESLIVFYLINVTQSMQEDRAKKYQQFIKYYKLKLIYIYVRLSNHNLNIIFQILKHLKDIKDSLWCSEIIWISQSNSEQLRSTWDALR